MKQIHIDIPNEKGESVCYEKMGGFFSALGALYAVWRYGIGRIEIGDMPQPENPNVTDKKNDSFYVS